MLVYVELNLSKLSRINRNLLLRKIVFHPQIYFCLFSKIFFKQYTKSEKKEKRKILFSYFIN